MNNKYRLSIIILTILAFKSYISPLYSYDSLDPIKRISDLTQVAKLPYNLIKRYTLQNDPYQQALLKLQAPFPPAKETLKELGTDFSVSIGISMSQTEYTNNIIHPNYLSHLLQQKSKSQPNPSQWLKDRWGYVVRATENITCQNCNKTTNLDNMQPTDPFAHIIVTIMTSNKTAPSLTISKCPYCNSSEITKTPKKILPFTKEEQTKFIQQLQTLGIFDQSAAKTTPPYRLSLELADIINENGAIDATKLKNQVELVQSLKNPLLFMHHYANPQYKPHLFENKEDITWFANTCAELIENCTNVTHVCPISQIIGFGLQVSRQQALPPFSCNINQDQFLQNIVDAQVTAGKAMKAKKPNLKVLVSHQWKPMKPMHSFGDPRHALECLICTIADRMYNQKFVELLQKHTDSFDGIALSIYPALYFNMTTPCGNNCNGTLDHEAALEAIVQTSKAFPDKDIYIVETGCNNPDQNIKKQFVDMTLYVCKLARDMGIPVKACYFWGHANEPYFEWNKLPGTSYFGAFENLSPDSINDYGKYLQEILKQ